MIPTAQQGFVLRPPLLDDIPATVELINASSLDRTARMDRSSYTVDQIRSYWEQPDFNYSKDIRLAVDSGQIVGYCGIVPTIPDKQYEIMAYTHPTQRGRGIGTALMQWGEARIIEKHSAATDDEQVIVHCNNFSKNVAGTQLLLDLDYRRIRSFYEMKIEMNSAPSPPIWPTGISVRSMIAEQEEKAVYLANEEAFRGHLDDVDKLLQERFPKWLAWVRSVPGYDPGFFFVAQEGDEIVGVALCFPKDPEFPDMCLLHALSVRQTWRRRGIGTALLQHVFGECYRQDIYKVVVTVDSTSPTGETELYEKAGMHVFLQWDTYQKELSLR